MLGDKSTPMCGVGKMQCYYDAEQELINNDFIDKTLPIPKDCDCLPACTTITYDTEIANLKFDWQSGFDAHNYAVPEG